MITIEVLGVPAPKGSGRAILIGGKARHVPSGSNANRDKLKSWDTALREAAKLAIGEATAPPFLGVPLRMTVVFRMSRPSGHYSKATGELRKSAPAYPATKPDSSKLLRSTEDTLNGVVFDDDSRIVSHCVDKVYAAPGNEGATITVSLMLQEATICTETNVPESNAPQPPPGGSTPHAANVRCTVRSSAR